MKNRPSKIQQGCLNSKQEDGQEEARWNWSIDVNSLSTFLGRYHEDNLKWSVRFGRHGWCDACESCIHWDANNQVHHQERKGIGPSDASGFKLRNMDFNSEFKIQAFHVASVASFYINLTTQIRTEFAAVSPFLLEFLNLADSTKTHKAHRAHEAP